MQQQQARQPARPSDWHFCRLLWGFSGRQEGDAENKPILLLYIPGAGDDLSQDKFYTCLVSPENAQFQGTCHLYSNMQMYPGLLMGCNADVNLWLRQDMVPVFSSGVSWGWSDKLCHSLHVSVVSSIESIQLFVCWHIFHSSTSSPLPPSLA